MKNAIKIVSILLIIAILGGCSVTGIKSASVKSQAIEYLCEKYDAKPEEFELVDYRIAQTAFIDNGSIFQKPKWVDYAFEFKYNGRNFFVNREDEEFYDDYQLEDVEKWCTEWLQQNVDERIIGMGLSTTSLLDYYHSSNKSFGYLMKTDDTEEILKSVSPKESNDYFIVYYYDKTINPFKDYSVSDYIEIQLKNVFGNGKEYDACYSSNGVKIDIEKINYNSWERNIKYNR
ncbi:MAG: hypothetical protein ACI4IL_01805 [Eubacterium sp.]